MAPLVHHLLLYAPLLGLGTVWLTGPRADAEPPGHIGHARLHPAGSDVFVEAPDVQGMLSAYEQSALARFFDDPGVSARLGALAGRERFGWRDLFTIPAQALSEESPGHAQALRLLGSMRSASFSLAGLSAGGERLVDEIAVAVLNEQALDATRSALRGEYFATGAYPESLDGVVLEDGSLPLDAWGREFEYAPSGGGEEFELASLGSDGLAGGTGIDADMVGEEADVAAFVQILAAHLGLQVVVELPDEDTAESAFELLFTAGADSVIERAGDVAHVRLPGMNVTLWGARRGAMLAFGFGTSTPEGFAALADAPGGGAAQRFARFQQGLPTTGQLVLRGYHDVNWGAIGKRIAQRIQEDFEFDFPQITTLGEELESGLPSGGFVTTLSDGRFQKESSALSGARPSPYGMPGMPLDLEVVGLVPADAIFAWASNLDARRASEEALESMATGLPGEFASWMASPASERLRSELFANLGDTLVVYSGPWKRLGLPRVYSVMSLRDPQAVEAALRDLPNLLPDGFAEALGYKSKEYRGTTYYSMSMEAFVPKLGDEYAQGGSQAGPMAGPFGATSPGLCVLNGRLVSALSAGDLKDLIKQGGLAEGTGSSGPLAALLADHPDAVDGLMIDWGAILSDVYAMGRNMATMIMGKSEIDEALASYPDPNVLIALAQPSLSFTRPMPGNSGGLLTHGESSFGPEVLPVILVAAAGMALRVEAAPERQSADEDARIWTDEALGELRVALKVHHTEKGLFPAALSELVAASPNFPNGFLGSPRLPLDGWSQEFAYAVGPGGKSCRVWSAGANGVFEEGQGDDVELELGETR